MNLELTQTSFQAVKDIVVPEIFNRRLKTGIPEVDEFFGQGLLPGQTFTLTARAGGGKTTFVLQVLEAMALQGYKVGIASGEESIYQLAYTAKRLNLNNVEIANIADIDVIVKFMKEYDVLIIDSFQGLITKNEFNSREHEKYCIELIAKAAKENECVCGIICHLTKMGVMKGGTVVLHAVDMNMKIDHSMDDNNPELRKFIIEKNRFGSNNEMNCHMTEKGYEFGRVIEVAEEETASSKKNRREDLWKEIANIKGAITIKKVLPLVDGNLQKAMIVLREMVLNDIIVKEGRGEAAEYSLLK